MKRVLKWIGIVIGGLLGIIILAYVVLWAISASRLNRTYEVTAVYNLTLPTDPERIAAGEKLYTIYCESCHGANLAGASFSEDPAFGEIYSANLTSGANGIGRSYSDDEIARAIWYGVKQDGSPTVGMPYEFNQGIHVGDMENLLAYLRSAPPVDTNHPTPSYGPMLRVFHAANLFPLVTAENAEMSQPPPAIVSPDDTLAYGAYLSVFCTACPGIAIAESPSLWTAVTTWTEAEFEQAMTQGVRPDGSQMDPEMMPWPSFNLYTEAERHAIWAYLQSLDLVATE
ncbi:MAG TPA: cytochrome c [Chloroflexota bacterium]|nr:cytochrome c [Chloroflexota bacterium]